MNRKKITWYILLLVVNLVALNARKYKEIITTGPSPVQEPPGDIPQVFAP